MDIIKHCCRESEIFCENLTHMNNCILDVSCRFSVLVGIPKESYIKACGKSINFIAKTNH